MNFGNLGTEKLESTEDATDLKTDGCYFGSVDLKDAYYSILIHEIYQKYRKLFWKEESINILSFPMSFHQL